MHNNLQVILSIFKKDSWRRLQEIKFFKVGMQLTQPTTTGCFPPIKVFRGAGA
jgi:hypothetical protein